MALSSTIDVDDYFLSATNPIATADQRDIEALALRLIDTPEAKDGRRQVEFRWRTLMRDEPPQEAWDDFDAFIDEQVYNYALHAANCDANYPRLVRLFYMPHRWFGLDVPGSRAGGGGPSSYYTMIPIEHGASYELSGTFLAPAPVDTTFTLCGNISLAMTLSSLHASELVTDEDGNFTITIDGGVRETNHIRTKPGALYLFIRESPSDWRQVPAALRIRKLDPPRMPALTFEELAVRTRDFMVDDVAMMHWFRSFFAYRPRNLISDPIGSGSIGGLISQMSCFGNIKLADDEALVITFGSGDAAYRDVTLNNYWNIPIDFRSRTSSLNNAQAIPNPDGSTTYIISKQDPGYHNWLDPDGRSEFILINRWQGLPAPIDGGGAPSVASKLCKITDVAGLVPDTMVKVDAAARARQIAAREQDYDLRFSV